MAFDYSGARKEGYSDEEIANHLSSSSGFDLRGAVENGYNYSEIVQHLSGTPVETEVVDDPEIDKTFSGYAGEIPRGLARGVVGIGESIATGLSSLLPEEQEQAAREKIAEVGEDFREPFLPKAGYEDTLVGKLSEGVGSTAPFLLTGPLGLVRGTAAAIGLGAAAQSGEAVTRAVAEGATEEQIDKAAAFGVIPGVLEGAVPFAISRNFLALRKALGEGAANSLVQSLKRVAVSAGSEGLQEASSEIAQNLIAQNIYSPETGTFTNTGEAFGLGAGVGGIIQGLFELALPRNRAPSFSPTSDSTQNQAQDLPTTADLSEITQETVAPDIQATELAPDTSEDAVSRLKNLGEAYDEDARRTQTLEKLDLIAPNLRGTLKGRGLDDIGLKLSYNLENLGGMARPEEIDALYDPDVKTIFLGADRIKGFADMDAPQLQREFGGLVDHEMVHAVKRMNLWKDSEWRVLENAARKNFNSEGTSYLQTAQERYSTDTAEIQSEEAIAELIRDTLAGRTKLSGQPLNLMQRLLEFFRKMGNSLTGTGYASFGQVVNDIDTGVLGARPRGGRQATPVGTSIIGGSPAFASRRVNSNIQGQQVMNLEGMTGEQVAAEELRLAEQTTRQEQAAVGVAETRRILDSTEEPLASRGRMDRADEQGLTKTLYHGTFADIDAFDPNMVDVGTHLGTAEQANERLKDVYKYRNGMTTDELNLLSSQRFVGGDGRDSGANVIPVRANLGRSLEMIDVGMWGDSEKVISELEDMPEFRGKFDEAWEELGVKDSYEDSQDWLDSPENREMLDEINAEIKKQGYDSIRYANQVENKYGNLAGTRPEIVARKKILSDELKAMDSSRRSTREAPTTEDVKINPNAVEEWIKESNVKASYSPRQEQRIIQINQELKSLDKLNKDDIYSYIILDPKNIRSVNAEFAASAAGSSNLLASRGRLDRAKEQGFDTSKVLYHYTNKLEDGSEFNQFIPSTRGKIGAGVYLSPSPNYSETYVRDRNLDSEDQSLKGFSENSRAIPVYVKGNIANREEYGRALEEAKAELDSQTDYDVVKQTAQNKLKEQGYSGINFVRPRRGGSKFNDNELVIFDPKNIRSVNAEFAASAVGSSNLLASRGLLGLSEEDVIETPLRARGAIEKNAGLHVGYIEDFVRKYVPKSKAERESLARAKEQGFNTKKVWYHGTPYNFSEFKPLVKGEAPTLPGYFNELGFFFTDQRTYASGVSEDSVGLEDYMEEQGVDSYQAMLDGIGGEGNVIPVYSKVQNPFITNDIERIEYWLRENNKEFKKKFPEDADFDSRELDIAMREALQDMGYDGIINKFEADEGTWLIAFNPSDIRSVKATYDSSAVGSPNLLASRRASAKKLKTKPEDSSALAADKSKALTENNEDLESDQAASEQLIAVKKLASRNNPSDIVEGTAYNRVADISSKRAARGQGDINNALPFEAPSSADDKGFVYQIQDKFIDLKKAVENIRKNRLKRGLTPLASVDDPYLGEESMHGIIGNKFNNFQKDVLEPLVNKLKARNISLKELEEFLVLRHAIERNTHVRKINAESKQPRPELQDGGAGSLNGQRLLDNYVKNEMQSKYGMQWNDSTQSWEGGNPRASVLNDLAADFDSITRGTLQELKDSGLMDQKSLDKLQSYYKYYAPLRGRSPEEDVAIEEHARFSKSSNNLSIKGVETEATKGRVSEAMPPLAQIVTQRQTAIRRGSINELVGQRMLSLIRENPNDSYWKIHNSRDSAGANAELFGVKEDGKQLFVEFKDRRLRDAMLSLDAPQTNKALAVMRKINRFFSAVNTSYNPAFVFGNFFRDLGTAIGNLVGEQTMVGGKALNAKGLKRAVFSDTPASIRQVYRGLRGKKLAGKSEQDWKDYLESGAKTEWFHVQTPEESAASIDELIEMSQGTFKGNYASGKKAIGNIVSDLNSAVENGVRFATFKKGRDEFVRMGLPREEALAKAATLAKNLTVNFNRMGNQGELLNAFYLFFNASVQGTANFVRGITTSRSKQAMLLSMVSFGAFVTRINELMGEDDEELGKSYYSQIEPWVKERNFILMKSIFDSDAPPNEYYTVPLPYGYNVLHVLGMNIMDVAMGKKSPEAATTQLASTSLSSFMPVGFGESENPAIFVTKGITPQIGKPIVEMLANEDFFGSPVYTENLQFGPKIPAALRSQRSTPAAFTETTKFLNAISDGDESHAGKLGWISPDVLDHLFGTILGGLGSFVERSAQSSVSLTDWVEGDYVEGDISINDIPFLRKAMREVTGRESQSNYYDRRDDIMADDRQMRLLRGAERGEYRNENRSRLLMKRMLDSTDKRLRNINKRLAVIGERILTSTSLEQTLRLEEMQQRLEDQKESAYKRFNKRFNEKVGETK